MIIDIKKDIFHRKPLLMGDRKGEESGSDLPLHSGVMALPELRIRTRKQFRGAEIAVYLVVILICLVWGETSRAAFWSNAIVPRRIALLLPLEGEYAEPGQAIRDGFLAAYYQSLPQDSAAPTIRIVDTSGGDIVQLYHQAIAQGANMVVGPLSKDQSVRLVQNGEFPVPTLLLNTIANAPAAANLYQFSLSPEDEAKQVADQALQDGKKSAIIIAPANAWGQRVSQSFISEWQKSNGRVVSALYYDNPEKFSGQVAQLLHVNQSEQRAKALRHLLLQAKMRAIPYRRHDIDMIFLAAKPAAARELRPLLNFYYAANIPVYATSHLYSGLSNPTLDQDLNGVQFCAMPAEIAPQTLSADLQATLHSIQQTWPQAYQKQPQLFAFGVDSYWLARNLGVNATSVEINGATGKLTLQAGQVWRRQLPWAQIVKGTALNREGR